jgi:hypothetical protein
MQKLLKTDKDKEQFLTWLAVLEAGGIPQIRHHLQTKDGFCCLGVACALFTPDDKIKVLSSGSMEGDVPDLDQPYSPLWLRRINNDFAARVPGTSIADLNDYHLSSFAEIASKLRKTYADELK